MSGIIRKSEDSEGKDWGAQILCGNEIDSYSLVTGFTCAGAKGTLKPGWSQKRRGGHASTVDTVLYIIIL